MARLRNCRSLAIYGVRPQGRKSRYLLQSLAKRYAGYCGQSHNGESLTAGTERHQRVNHPDGFDAHPVQLRKRVESRGVAIVVTRESALWKGHPALSHRRKKGKRGSKPAPSRPSPQPSPPAGTQSLPPTLGAAIVAPIAPYWNRLQAQMAHGDQLLAKLRIPALPPDSSAGWVRTLWCGWCC